MTFKRGWALPILLALVLLFSLTLMAANAQESLEAVAPETPARVDGGGACL